MNFNQKNDELRVFIVTQDEPFYLASAFKYLFNSLPSNVCIVGAYVLEGSPFGKRKSFLQKALDTFKIFGFRFFVFYSSLYILNKLFLKSVPSILKSQLENVKFGQIDINSEESYSHIDNLNPDIIVSIASNQIFQKPLLELPRLACLNLHTAKLPKYRGLMPLFWAMLNGEQEIGVTVFEMDEGLDSGPIVQQDTLPILKYSMHSLIKQTKKVGMLLIIRALENYSNNDVKYCPNNDKDSSRVKFPKKKDTDLFKRKGYRFF